MRDYKQISHFSRLAQLGVNKEIYITLPEVAEVMCTTARHCRTVLNEMTRLGWIKWTPKVGRNQRSCLYLIYTEERLKIELAQQFVLKGKYDKALEIIDNDQAQFAQILKETSGTQQRHGQLHVQLTYDRTFSALLPHIPLRNSEHFLVRQVYSCLTQCDQYGTVMPDLAHHWVYDEKKLSWKFYLRPHLQFHNNHDITATEIVDLFKQLKTLPLYAKELSHIDSINKVNPLCVEFMLNQPDSGFAGLLSDVKYSIQPSSQLLSAPSVTGSGLFCVQEHSKQRLTLQAFDGFHGLRALTDTVTIWQLPEHASTIFGDTKLQAGLVKQAEPSDCAASDPTAVVVKHGPVDITDPKSHDAQTSRVEDGCLLAILNSHADLSLLQRQYLSQLIAADNLFAELCAGDNQVAAIPAYNLLPAWTKILITQESPQPLPKSLTIATFEHHALKKCAEAISAILSRVGVRCCLSFYSFDEFYAKASEHTLLEDIILTSMNLGDNRPVSAFCWLLSNPVLHQTLPAEQGLWLIQKLYSVRNTLPIAAYMHNLESIASTLIASHYLLPMFHHKQTLRFAGVLKSVAINSWGWPELKDVWFDE